MCRLALCTAFYFSASVLPPFTQALILLLAEDDEALVLAAWSGLDALAATIPKQDAPSHVTAVKEAVMGAKEKVSWSARQQCHVPSGRSMRTVVALLTWASFLAGAPQAPWWAAAPRGSLPPAKGARAAGAPLPSGTRSEVQFSVHDVLQRP